ncbi:Glutamine synthetase [uncultured virus]|nr:Glutamine synthetase [uncultured virus]
MDCIIVDYVWIDGDGKVRSKTRVLPGDQIIAKPRGIDLADIPDWNYDGSSTNQAHGENSEVFLKPRRLFRSPFYMGIPTQAYVIMCDTYDTTGAPAKYNHRARAAEIFDKYEEEQPWYGLEQEYFIYSKDTNQPLGMAEDSVQGPFYCGVGGLNAAGRELVDRHMTVCIMMGIKISGTNAEVAPGQWEYQIGPVEGIDAADQLWMSRYVLERLSEQYGAYIVYHPKPLTGDWNGSGCHTNFSTERMRAQGGLKLILEAMPKLEATHKSHMALYGELNELRMSGAHETSSYDKFTYGIGNRGASVRIPFDTIKNDCGYFEDRRPASNMDPYLVTAKILETVMN